MTSIQKLRAALWSAVLILIVGGTITYLTQGKDADVEYSDEVNKDAAEIGKGITPGFSLTDMNGKKVTIASWPGRYKLIYFGYTNCPDVCPTGLQTISQALEALPPATTNDIQPLLITIDPDRDTPETLKVYTKQFHSKIIGLTGTKEQIEKTTSAFKVYSARVPEPEGVEPSHDEYLMDHSDVIYLLGKDNHFIKAYTSSDLKSAELAADLKKQIK